MACAARRKRKGAGSVLIEEEEGLSRAWLLGREEERPGAAWAKQARKGEMARWA